MGHDLSGNGSSETMYDDGDRNLSILRSGDILISWKYKHAHPFNGPFSRTTWVSRCQKGKTSLDWNEAKMTGFGDDSGISWTICKQFAPSPRQITTSTPHHSIFAGQMLFLTPNQQCQSTEGKFLKIHTVYNKWQKVDAQKQLDPFIHFDRTPSCEGRTDEQTDTGL